MSGRPTHQTGHELRWWRVAVLAGVVLAACGLFIAQHWERLAWMPETTALPPEPQRGARAAAGPDDRIAIPGGTVTLGCVRSHDGGRRRDPSLADNCSSWDRPSETRAEVGQFYIDRYEVAEGRFLSCVEAGACPPRQDVPRVANGSAYWHVDASPSLPATWVSLSQAQAFCTWTGGRLPTEQEWIRAARGGTNWQYPWGDASTPCGKAALSNHLCGGESWHYPAEADAPTQDISAFGVWHMFGNVSEWIAPPADAEATTQATQGEPMSFIMGNSIVGASPRPLSSRAMRSRDRGAQDIGFRCAYDAAPGRTSADTP